MFQLRHLLPLIVTGILLVACTAVVPPTQEAQGPEGSPSQPEEVTTPDASESDASAPDATIADADVQAQAEANNLFGLDLLHALQQQEDEQNIFFSPLSLSLVLQMAYNGALGETAQEMAVTLHLDGAPLDTTNAASGQLQDNLRAAEDVELLIGNSIWLHDGVALSPDFTQRVQSTFAAQVEALDFSNPQSVDTINNWVSEQTEGEIQEIVTNLSPDIMLYLINAVYFKGAWETPFNPDMTHTRAFHLASGDDMDVEMMTQDSTFLQYQDERLSAVALPYAGDRLQMLVVLPNTDTALAGLTAELDYETWQTITSSLSESRLVLSLPRFELEYESSMISALQSMGMQRAFAAADFSNMVEDGGLSISEVMHKAVVRVDEEGTVAAAASGVAMATSMPPEFTVDRPFLFAIHDTQTGAILFIGVVYEPQPIS